MKKIKNFLREIKNFWNYLSLNKKIAFVFYLLITVSAIPIVLLLGLSENYSFDKILGIFSAIFFYDKIYGLINEYDEQIKELKERTFHLYIIWNIFKFNKNTIYSLNDKCELGKMTATQLAYSLTSMNDSIDSLLGNRTLTVEEKRTIFLISVRINDFLNENNTIKLPQYEAHFDDLININTHHIIGFMRFFEEKYRVEEKQRGICETFMSCDISIEKMKNKYDFGYIS